MGESLKLTPRERSERENGKTKLVLFYLYEKIV